MTDEPEEQPAAPAPAVPPDLRLRGERPRVTRLSRKVLITLGAVSALAVAGALGYALQTHNKGQSGQELLSTQNRPSAEGLAGLPKDYTGLPRQAPPLGPPLPGDLGKPILNAGAAPNATVPATTPDPAAQRLAQETEAARVSRLFAQTNQQPQPVSLVTPAATGTQSGPTPTPPVDAGSAQNMQDRKTAFLNATPDKRTVTADRLEARRHPMSCRPEQSFPRHSSPASAPICRGRSPPRSRRQSMTARARPCRASAFLGPRCPRSTYCLYALSGIADERNLLGISLRRATVKPRRKPPDSLPQTAYLDRLPAPGRALG